MWGNEAMIDLQVKRPDLYQFRQAQRPFEAFRGLAGFNHSRNFSVALGLIRDNSTPCPRDLICRLLSSKRIYFLRRESKFQQMKFSLNLLSILTCMLNYIHHETTAQQDCRLIDVMMLVARLLSAFHFTTFREPRGIPQSTDSTGLQQEDWSITQRFPSPSHSHCPEDMSMSYNNNITSCLVPFSICTHNALVPSLLNIPNHPIQSPFYFGWTFTPWATILPDIPSCISSLFSPLFMDLLGR